MASSGTNSSWVETAQTSIGRAAQAAGDTAVRATSDVAAAGVRVEHRINPYDAPAQDVSSYEYGLEVALIVCVLLLVAILAWFIYKNLCQQDEPSKADYMTLVGNPIEGANRGLESALGGVNSALEGIAGGVGAGSGAGLDAKDGARLRCEMDEMKGAINSLAARMQQAEDHHVNTDRRFGELRSDLDDLMQSSGPKVW